LTKTCLNFESAKSPKEKSYAGTIQYSCMHNFDSLKFVVSEKKTFNVFLYGSISMLD